MGNKRTRYYIRILAGAYILYCAYRLISGIVKGEATGNGLIISGIGSAAFIIIGLVIILFSLRDLKVIKEEEKREEEERRKQEAEAAKARRDAAIAALEAEEESDENEFDYFSEEAEEDQSEKEPEEESKPEE